MKTHDRITQLLFAMAAAVGLVFAASPQAEAGTFQQSGKSHASSDTFDKDAGRPIEELQLLDTDTSEGPDAEAEDGDATGEDEEGDGDGRALGHLKKVRVHGSSSGIAKGDFNGDGIADLAVGVPDKNTPATVTDSGCVIVIYGSSSGLTTTTVGIPLSQFWSQNTPGIDPVVSESSDHFGGSLASGDFNGDHFSDLAIGIPDEDITITPPLGFTTTYVNAGGVVIIYGSPNGLVAGSGAVRGSQFFDLASGPYQGRLQNGFRAGTRLGASLAWGDFNRDGFGDLAIGAPGHDVSLAVDAGAVLVLYGSTNGLTEVGEQFWTMEDTGLGLSSTFLAGFGTALSGGDFNGDGVTDLAIGAPLAQINISGTPAAGRVIVLYGVLPPTGVPTAGLSTAGAQNWSQSSAGVVGGSEGLDLFGAALASGNFNGDGATDLAIGVPGEDDSMGRINVIYGRLGSGLVADGNQIWYRNTLNLPVGNPTTIGSPGDSFGATLAAGDFNGDNRADLAIGVPFADGGSQLADAGEVDVIYGSASGLSIASHVTQRFTPPPGASAGSHYGASLTAWNFGRNETGSLHQPADLAIGLPGTNVAGVIQAGAVHVLYGSSTIGTAVNNGLSLDNFPQVWSEVSAGMPTAAATSDHFGAAMY